MIIINLCGSLQPAATGLQAGGRYHGYAGLIVLFRMEILIILCSQLDMSRSRPRLQFHYTVPYCAVNEWTNQSINQSVFNVNCQNEPRTKTSPFSLQQ